MQVRPASHEDAVDMRAFCCTTATDGWAYEVEVAIRESLDWQRKGPQRRVLVLIDDSGKLLGVACYRPLFLTNIGYGWTIEVLGIDWDRHKEGLATQLATEVILEVARDSPGGYCAWFVHKDNTASLALADKLGAANTMIEEPPKDYESRVLRLPETKA